MRLPFFPRVLIHLVGFDLWIRQAILRRLAGEPGPLSLPGRFLNAMTPLQHRRVGQIHLVGKLLGWNPLRKPSKKHHGLPMGHNGFSTTPYR
jgi:hypothetical protein